VFCGCAHFTQVFDITHAVHRTGGEQLFAEKLLCRLLSYITCKRSNTQHYMQLVSAALGIKTPSLTHELSVLQRFKRVSCDSFCI